MSKIKIPQHNKKVIITTIVSILVSISSYVIMYVTTYGQYEKEISDKLYMIGKEQSDWIERIIKEVEEEILFVSNLSGIKNMNKDEIIAVSSYLTSTKSRYKGLIVMDIKGSVLYGYVKKPELIYENASFERAISSKSIIGSMKEGSGDYGIELYCPIIDNKNATVGIIYVSMPLDEITKVLKNIKNEGEMESYLVNKEGIMLTESKSIPDSVSKVKVNLNYIKLSVDYSETNPYTDYSGAKVYGRYFPIKGTEWTLVIESDYEHSKMKQEKTTAIGKVTVAIQGLLVLMVQMYLKSRFNLNISDEEINELLNIRREREGEK